MDSEEVAASDTLERPPPAGCSATRVAISGATEHTATDGVALHTVRADVPAPPTTPALTSASSLPRPPPEMRSAASGATTGAAEHIASHGAGQYGAQTDIPASPTTPVPISASPLSRPLTAQHSAASGATTGAAEHTAFSFDSMRPTMMLRLVEEKEQKETKEKKEAAGEEEKEAATATSTGLE